MKKNYTSLKTVINDYTLKSGNTRINPDDILYIANDIAELIIPGDAFVQQIALLDVDNYKAQLPSNFKWVQQAAYRTHETNCHDCKIDVGVVTDYTKKIYGTDCNIDVSVRCDACTDCNTKIITMDADYNYLLKNQDYLYKHANHFYGGRSLDGVKDPCSTIMPEFKLMRRTTNYFFNVPYHVNECMNFNVDTSVEYNITPPTITVNFKYGQILLSYLGVEIDDEGYRMIPNTPEVYNAIRYSIDEILAEQEFRVDKSQNNRIYLQMLEAKARKARVIAKAALSTLDPDEWEMFLRNHWVRKVPQYKWERTHNKFVGDKTYSNNHLIGRF